MHKFVYSKNMALENDDPFSKLSHAESKPQETSSFWGDIEGDDGHEHSDTYDPEREAKAGGHISRELKPEDDGLYQYEKMHPLQKEELRHKQNMNRLEEINAGLKTSSNMINTFQDNADAALRFNPNAYQLTKEIQGNLKEHLAKLDEDLLKMDRVLSPADESIEAFAKLEKLKEAIKTDYDFYYKQSTSSGNWALIFRVMSSALAAIVTVLLGLNITDYMKSLGLDWFVNFFALLISAFISVIGVIQGFYDVNEVFLFYKGTAYKLAQLLKKIDYLEAGSDKQISLHKVNLIFLAHTRIIESVQEYEIQVRTEGDAK